ncbi:MAG: glycosyltransferase family 4 protein [Candidatus Coatesbacteria bacterium]|nr:glycosyltransferase family 4 protein [Candidatus Coatesbacteria bacterium]
MSDSLVTLMYLTFPSFTEPYLIEVAEALVQQGKVRAIISATSPDIAHGASNGPSRELRRHIYYLPYNPIIHIIKWRFFLDFAHAMISNPRALMSLISASRKVRKGLRNAWYHIVRLLPAVPYLRGILHIQSSGLIKVFPELLEIDGVDIIVTLRGMETSVTPYYDDVWRGVLTEAVFRRAAILHFVSDFLREEGYRLGAPRDKAVVIRQSISERFFTLNGDVRDEDPIPVILSVGRLVWFKGFQYAIQAAAILKDRGREFRYLIVGGGELKPFLQLLIDHLGLRDYIELLGPQSSDGVMTMLRRASIFLCPSICESLGRQLMEAQAFGVPVVATNVGGICDNVSDGETALCVPPFEPEKLADKIEYLMDNPDVAQEMGRAGKTRAQRLFRVKNEVLDLTAIYSELGNTKASDGSK